MQFVLLSTVTGIKLTEIYALKEKPTPTRVILIISLQENSGVFGDIYKTKHRGTEDTEKKHREDLPISNKGQKNHYDTLVINALTHQFANSPTRQFIILHS